MWLCEDKLKGKTVHFRLSPASEKRACLSSLLIALVFEFSFNCKQNCILPSAFSLYLLVVSVLIIFALMLVNFIFAQSRVW